MKIIGEISMSFIINDVNAIIYHDSKKHETLDIPKVNTPFEDVEEHSVLAVSFHVDGPALVTIQKPEGPKVYLLPTDIPHSLEGWVRNMQALSRDGDVSFPLNVKFGKYRDKYFAHTS